MSNPRITDELDAIQCNSLDGIMSTKPVIDAGKLYQTLLKLYRDEKHQSGIVPLHPTRLVTSLLVKLVGRPLEQVTTFILPDDDHIQNLIRDGYAGVEVRIAVTYLYALTHDREYEFPNRFAKQQVITSSVAKYNQTHSVSKGDVFIPCIKENQFREILTQLRAHGSSVYVDWRSSGLDDVFLNDNEVQHESTREMS